MDIEHVVPYENNHLLISTICNHGREVWYMIIPDQHQDGN